MTMTKKETKALAKRLAAKWIKEIKEKEEARQRRAMTVLEKWGWGLTEEEE